MTDSQALQDSVYDAIQKKIINGQLKPGSRIIESRIAKKMGVSRTPLREALFRLEQDGFVKSELNKGFIVQGLSAREVREIYPVLWTLEAQALELSGNLAFTQNRVLTTLNNHFNKEKSNSIKSQMADTIFHQTIIGKCPNKFLLQLIEKLRSMIQRYEYIFMLDSSFVSESVKQHKSIIEALEKHDMLAAKEALIKNWHTGLKNLLLVIGEP